MWRQCWKSLLWSCILGNLSCRLVATKVMIGGTLWFNGYLEQKMFGSLVIWGQSVFGFSCTCHLKIWINWLIFQIYGNWSVGWFNFQKSPNWNFNELEGSCVHLFKFFKAIAPIYVSNWWAFFSFHSLVIWFLLCVCIVKHYMVMNPCDIQKFPSLYLNDIIYFS